MVWVGEDSSVGVDVVSRLDLTPLHSVAKQTHLSISLSLPLLCPALLPNLSLNTKNDTK